MITTNTTAAPVRVWLGNLAAYSAGQLLGAWVDLPCDDFGPVLDAIGCGHGAEFAIFDSETAVDGLTVGEFSNLDELNACAAELLGLSDVDLDMIGAAVSDGYTLREAIDLLPDMIAYPDAWNDCTLGEAVADESGVLDRIPSDLQSYFDFDAFGRDLRLEGHFILGPCGYYVEIMR